METIRDLLAAALRKISVLGNGETMSASNGNDALMALQVMVDDMANENLLIPVTTLLSKVVVQGQASYTIGVHASPPGPTNHIETAKPISYASVYIRDGAGNDYPVSIIPTNQYAAMGQKLTAGRPSCVYIQDGWPLDTLVFDSSFLDSTDIIKIYALLPLSTYLTTASLNDVISLPPGYKRMLMFNLCIELAPEYEKIPSAVIVKVAQDTKRGLKAKNLTMGKVMSDYPRSRSHYGYYNVQGGPVQ